MGVKPVLVFGRQSNGERAPLTRTRQSSTGSSGKLTVISHSYMYQGSQPIR